ncbi:hypothetical protein AAII07_35740 [Microvirga sp. 0TCS3.31]
MTQQASLKLVGREMLAMTNQDIETLVSRQLQRMTALNHQARLTGKTEDRYSYLAAVYNCAVLWNDTPTRQMIASTLAPKAVAPPDIFWFIDRITRLTSDDDRRLQEKHRAALKCAAFRSIAPEKVVIHIEKRGGLNACAASFRRQRSRQLRQRETF